MAKQQDHPNINPMIHPPVIALMFIVIASFLGRFVALPFMVPALLQTIGLFLSFIGFLLGIGALLEFQKARTTVDPLSSGVYWGIIATQLYFSDKSTCDSA